MVRFLNKALISFLVGAIVLGIGGRLWMFLIGWVLTGTFGFSLGGTMEVILFGGIIGLIAGLVYFYGLKNRIQKRLFEGAYFGLGTFLIVSFLPIGGSNAIEAYDPGFHFPILLGFSSLFFLYGLTSVWALNKNGY